jgi:hypothetical protein
VTAAYPALRAPVDRSFHTGGFAHDSDCWLALVLVFGTTHAYAAEDDDDDKVPAAEVTKIEETLSTLCSGYESLKKEEQGVYEIDDAKCKMGTVDIKLDKDYTVILISRY